MWDPATGSVAQGANSTTNLFCSWHAFLPDGPLLVVGGTTRDGLGSANAHLFNFRTNRWEATPAMNAGRWYPPATALASGRVLVSEG